MNYEYNKIITKILKEHLGDRATPKTLEKATYNILNYEHGSFIPYDNMNIGSIKPYYDENRNIPMTRISGSICYSPDGSEILYLDFTLYVCCNEIMYLSKEEF